MTHPARTTHRRAVRLRTAFAMARLVLAVALSLAAFGRGTAQTDCKQAAATSTSRFVPVTSAAELSDGCTVVIGNAAYGMLLGRAEERNRRKAVKADFIDGCPATVGSDVQLITLRQRSGGWRLEVGEGRCLAASASSTQVLKAVDTGSRELTIADIAISPATADADITFRGSIAYNTTVRFSPNGGDGFFWCYTSRYSVEPVQLYRRVDVVPDLTLDGDPSDGAAPDDLAPYASAVVSRLTLRRTLVADGGWHTLCLPFALTAADISGPLCGAEMEEPTTLRRTADGRVAVAFRRVGSTVAGRPYLVRVPVTVSNPVFCDKTLTALAPLAASLSLPADDSHAAVSMAMHGTYVPVAIEGTAFRFLSADGARLVVPDGSSPLRPYRAYFSVSTASPAFVVAHDGGAATPVDAPSVAVASPWSSSARYTLQGVPLPDGVSLPGGGIVVVGGRKYQAKSLAK